MSFHDDLLAVLPADLNTAIGVNTAGVYSGDQAQRVSREDLEVWVEALTTDSVGTGFGNESKIHNYNLHIRVKERREGDQSGEDRLATVKGHQETLVDRYNGTRPFIAGVPDIVQVRATEGNIAPDLSDDKVLDGIVVLELHERQS